MRRIIEHPRPDDFARIRRNVLLQCEGGFPSPGAEVRLPEIRCGSETRTIYRSGPVELLRIYPGDPPFCVGKNYNFYRVVFSKGTDEKDFSFQVIEEEIPSQRLVWRRPLIDDVRAKGAFDYEITISGLLTGQQERIEQFKLDVLKAAESDPEIEAFVEQHRTEFQPAQPQPQP